MYNIQEVINNKLINLSRKYSGGGGGGHVSCNLNVKKIQVEFR